MTLLVFIEQQAQLTVNSQPAICDIPHATMYPLSRSKYIACLFTSLFQKLVGVRLSFRLNQFSQRRARSKSHFAATKNSFASLYSNYTPYTYFHSANNIFTGQELDDKSCIRGNTVVFTPMGE